MVYEPYGKIRHNYKSGSYGNDYTFTGKELDSETSLQYFGARYYSGIAGRFTSSDPIFLALGSGNLNGLTDPQMWNSYAYGRNNPYRMVDPDGQIFMDTVATFGHAVEVVLRTITFRSRDRVEQMAQNGVTAIGVAQVAGGVVAGTSISVVSGLATGAALGVTALETGVATVAETVAAVTGADSVRGATGGGMTVYQSVVNGVTEYVGITNNLARRAAEHMSQSGREIRAIEGASNLTVRAARGLEQVLIEQNGLAKNGGTLNNLINSVSNSNPNYQSLVELGHEVLNAIQ
jgi:RHS repeat-associated protein